MSYKFGQVRKSQYSDYLSPLDYTLNDLRVDVYKDGYKDVKFPMNISEGRDSLRNFLKELYTKIHKETHPYFIHIGSDCQTLQKQWPNRD